MLKTRLTATLLALIFAAGSSAALADRDDVHHHRHPAPKHRHANNGRHIGQFDNKGHHYGQVANPGLHRGKNRPHDRDDRR
ncbi:MAG: hypothetical protein ABR591_00130 [Candidatus Velthaea sp.]